MIVAFPGITYTLFGSVIVHTLFIVAPIACGVFVLSHCFATQYLLFFLVFLSSRLVALFQLCSYCRLCLSLAVPWVGLWYVIVSFPGQTLLLRRLV